MKAVIFPLIVLVVCLFLLSTCTDEQEAGRILTANGYTNIEYTGYAWMACDEKDTYATGFNAISPNGTPISGAVCSGLFFKNSTIRFR